MNSPTCYSCADFEISPGAYTPGNNNEDKGRITLVAGVPYAVLFVRISVLDATKWIFRGIPSCYNANNEAVGFEITSKTGTGFTVTAMDNCTFEYNCVKI
jgi:hypothetical protein